MKRFAFYMFLVLFSKTVFAEVTLTQTQIMDFGTICHLQKTYQATIILTTNNTYSNAGSGSTVISKSGPLSGIINYALSNGNDKVTAVRTATTSLSCVNCADSSCALTVNSLSVNPQGQTTIKGGSSANFNWGGTLIIPSGGCPAGVYEGVVQVSFTKQGGSSESINMAIRATLVDEMKSIIVSADQNLSFGTILADGSYNVTIGTDGTRTSTNPGALSPGGTFRQGVFSLNNTTSGAVRVNGVTMDTNITLSNGVSDISAVLTSSPSVASISSVAKGKTNINVGGTLQMHGGESAGTYNGIYTLTVNY